MQQPGARDGDAPGELVRLAKAIHGCDAFSPKQWKGVMDRSASVLRRRGKTSSSEKRRNKRMTPREEDGLRGGRPFPSLSVAQYLNQPEMVASLLREAETEAQEEEVADELLDPEIQNEDQASEGELHERMEKARQEEEASTTRQHSDSVKKDERGVVLPLLTTISPRTRRGLAHLPPPREEEMREIERLERSVDHPEFFQDFYRELKRKRRLQARRRGTATALSNEQGNLQALSRSTALSASVRKPRRPRGPIKPLKSRKELDGVETTMTMSVEEKDRAQEADAQHNMEREDLLKAAGTQAKLSGRRVRNCKPKRSQGYSRLIQARRHAELKRGAAEYQVKETIDEIKQWIPLDVIYAVGLGKFASPAQQRAAEVLHRAGVRLKAQLLFLGMRQWKQFAVVMQEQEWGVSSSRLQCWWRQIRAKREASLRRQRRNEVQRRQAAFLALLASKQHQAACTITRCIRRDATQRAREQAVARQKAALCVQKFWRQVCTQWAALRREILRQRREQAAVCIQKHARRRIAQRRRILLRKVDAVEKRRRQKAFDMAARATHTRRLGAAVSIQRAFRNWQDKLVRKLRRSRAAFERDKRKILQVQAHYRGEKARRWVAKHRRAVAKAVLILQCSWRCYRARTELQRRKQQALARRDQRRKEIDDERHSRKPHLLVPIPLQKKWGQLSLVKAASGNASSSREVQAARKLQARWKGKQTRKRLRYEKAKEMERSRRAINRKRRLAAVCIQKRVRGIRGRVYAWRMVQERSAKRIQRVWRGYKTRVELLQMRYAVKMINRIQARWKARRNGENQRTRARNAAVLQRAARMFIGRKMLSAVVRRRQFLAEEHAVGKALEEKTRARVKDELLLQSFTLKSVKTLDLEETRVDRPLYVVDLGKRQWKRKGYDGVWQEVFRSACGNLEEMDNSHFARFLKALPHAFIHKSQFPMQNADIIFAKMKEPKAKTMSFPRFNKAMLMLLKEKFADPKESGQRAVADDTGSEHEVFLRFMTRFVLPCTIQNGKFRKMLEAHCTKRLLWSVAVLRRFAGRLATKKKHEDFVIVFREQQLHQHRSKCARTIQRAYRGFQFRLQWKAMLARMFLEYVDHTGRPVRFQHLASGKSCPKRPIFLKGVVCGKIVPLPFPGEEFHALCERHEDSSTPNASKVAADVYCVECEDAMCSTCFDRDHRIRRAFQLHQARRIPKCSYCRLETATRECLQCGNGKVPFCDSCFPHVHKQRPTGSRGEATELPAQQDIADEPMGSKHQFQPLVVMCVECSDRVAQWACETCLDIFCKRCMSSSHAKGQRQHHQCHRLKYFSVLRQKAELKREADVDKAREERNKRREEERRRQEQELVRMSLAATKIQARLRSLAARQDGKAYMRLVRQTQAARAQRKSDESVRSSIGYKLKAAFGVSPALKSDTKHEIAARRERLQRIKRALLLQRQPADKSKPATRRWSEQQKARVVEAARTWCDYDERVKILKGEWKNCVGTIVSTHNLMLTGSVLVFVPLASRSAVVRWEDLEPYDHDEALRRAYESPVQVALNMTRDFHAKVSHILEAAVRKARLLYLQTIEFHRILQYAWVVEYDKREQKVEYWNVVLNRRVATPPKAMQLIERMEPEDRDKLEKRVALARSKLVALLNPFQPQNKPSLALRRNAVVFVPSGVNADESSSSMAALKLEMEAILGARFWHDKVLPNRQFGGKKARKFLAACPSQACRSIVYLLNWMDLHEHGGFEPHAKKLLTMPDELQVYVAREVSAKVDSSGGDFKLARDRLLQLLQLKEATLQLLVTKDQRDVEEAEARQAQL